MRRTFGGLPSVLCVLALWSLAAAATYAKGHQVAIPEEASATMQKFRDALRRSDWQSALSFCSLKVRAKAAEYESPEQFFRDVVPIELVCAQEYLVDCGGRVDSKRWTYISVDSFVRGAEGWTWIWTVGPVDGVMQIDFEPVPLKARVEEQLLREKREKEAREGARKILEPKLNKVRTRLSALTKLFAIGRPMLFRLELVNESDITVEYDDQQVDVNGSMTIVEDRGKRVAYIGGPTQTAGAFEQLAPGASAVLFDQYDVGHHYNISRPGTYKVRFNGEGLFVWAKVEDRSSPFHGEHYGPNPGDVWASNTVEIDVGYGFPATFWWLVNLLFKGAWFLWPLFVACDIVLTVWLVTRDDPRAWIRWVPRIGHALTLAALLSRDGVYLFEALFPRTSRYDYWLAIPACVLGLLLGIRLARRFDGKLDQNPPAERHSGVQRSDVAMGTGFVVLTLILSLMLFTVRVAGPELPSLGMFLLWVYTLAAIGRDRVRHGASLPASMSLLILLLSLALLFVWFAAPAQQPLTGIPLVRTEYPMWHVATTPLFCSIVLLFGAYCWRHVCPPQREFADAPGQGRPSSQ